MEVALYFQVPFVNTQKGFKRKKIKADDSNQSIDITTNNSEFYVRQL